MAYAPRQKKIQGTLENRSTADSAGCSCFVCGRRTAVSAEEGRSQKIHCLRLEQ